MEQIDKNKATTCVTFKRNIRPTILSQEESVIVSLSAAKPFVLDLLQQVTALSPMAGLRSLERKRIISLQLPRNSYLEMTVPAPSELSYTGHLFPIAPSQAPQNHDDRST